MLWGAGISIVASFDSFTFLYYVLVMVAASALICLEPWVEFLCVVIATIVYGVLNYTVSGVKVIEPSLFISVLFLTVAIVLTCFFYNFFTRVNAIFLEYEIKNLNTVLEDKANTDKLTGVNNRLFLSEKLEQTANDDLTNVGIMMIDLDHFKLINDNYGHLAGDKCLSEIGRLIRDIINNKDAYCVRYGGEEFLVHFTSISKKELFDLAEKLRKVVEKNEVEIKENTKIKYTISIGLALGKDSKNYNSMIDQSDKALYLAKETRNSTKFVA